MTYRLYKRAICNYNKHGFMESAAVAKAIEQLREDTEKWAKAMGDCIELGDDIVDIQEQDMFYEVILATEVIETRPLEKSLRDKHKAKLFATIYGKKL